MPKKKTKSKNSPKTLLVLIIAVVAISAAFYIHQTRPVSNPRSFGKNQTVTASNPILANVDSALPSANWGNEQVTNEQTIYGNLKGFEQTGEITSAIPTYNHFENPEYLKSLGYTPDKNLDAAGPGAQVWGYKKTENGMDQVVILSYTTGGNTQNPNAPIQFNCPCKLTLKTFVSDPFKNTGRL